MVTPQLWTFLNRRSVLDSDELQAFLKNSYCSLVSEASLQNMRAIPSWRIAKFLLLVAEGLFGQSPLSPFKLQIWGIPYYFISDTPMNILHFGP